MTFEMTNTNRVITVYNLSSATNEFIGKGDGYAPANMELLAYYTDIAPLVVKDELTVVFDSESGKWSSVEDRRGKIVCSIRTGANIIINQLGKLSDDVVSIVPEGHFIKWDGEKQAYDVDVEKTIQIAWATQQKESLLALTTSKIVPLQDAVDLDIAVEAEVVLILAQREYRALLNRIKPNDVSYDNWPDMSDEK